MARFRNQVSKGIEAQPETDSQVTEAKNQKLENGNSKPETKNHNLENGSPEPETRNQKIDEKPETKNQKPENGSPEPETPIIYSESDMESVNVAGFKVPYIVREHWKKGCREKRVKLSPMLKRVLVDEFGLPPGLTLDDL